MKMITKLISQITKNANTQVISLHKIHTQREREKESEKENSDSNTKIPCQLFHLSCITRWNINKINIQVEFESNYMECFSFNIKRS